MLRRCDFNKGRNPPWRGDKRQCSFEVLNFTVEAFFKSAAENFQRANILSFARPWSLRNNGFVELT